MPRMHGAEGMVSYEDPTAPEGENVENNRVQIEQARRVKYFLDNQSKLTPTDLPEAEHLAAALEAMIIEENSRGHLGNTTVVGSWKRQQIILQGIIENLKPRAIAKKGPGFMRSLKNLASRVNK